MSNDGTWILKQLSPNKMIFATGIKKSQIITDAISLRDEITKRLKKKKNFRIAVTQEDWTTWAVITLKGVTVEEGWSDEYGGFWKYKKD